MNYKIIGDLEKLQEFVDFLPELEGNETYYIALQARNKYLKDSDVSIGSKVMLKRTSTDKRHLIQKLKQWECALGSYEYKGKPIPQEALAVYIHINPRCRTLATSVMLQEIGKLGVERVSEYSPKSIALTAIQSSKSCRRKIYSEFDFDFKKVEDVFYKILTYDLINIDACRFVKTRGGFHLLIKNEAIETKYIKKWYNNIRQLECDQTHEIMCPIVGTYQGDYIPQLLTHIEYDKMNHPDFFKE